MDKKVGGVEIKNYSLNKNILTIRTECGDYGFKIDDDSKLTSAPRIAELMVTQMQMAEKSFKNGSDTSNSYAKLLLSNLILSEKYVQLEHQYNGLIKENEKLKLLYRQRLETNDDRKPDFHKPDLQFHKPDLPKDQPLPKPVSEEVKPHDPPCENRDISEQPQEKRSYIHSSTETKPQEKVGDSSGSIAFFPCLPDTKHDNHESTYETRTDSETDPETACRTAHEDSTAGDSSEAASKEVIAPPYTGGRSSSEEETVGGEEEVGSSFQWKSDHPERTPTPFRESAPPDLSEFMLPSLYFLREGGARIEIDHEAIRRDAELLEQKLSYFGITGEIMEVSKGPVITTFEYRPDPGIKISKIVNLADDLALALSALSIRIVAPIPGKDVVGIEIPNEEKSIVPFLDIVSSDDFIDSRSKLPLCLGKDIIGNPVVMELDKMPHLLIAGATGTGKSVGLNAMIASILYKSPPDKVNFIMIDPKRIELSLFNGIPHLLTPVITDMKKANFALQWAVREMERRYEILAKLQVRNIEQYNEKVQRLDLSKQEENPFEPFAYIVIIIDELADLMMTAAKDIEFSLTRLAQMARAAGIHLVLATQRPSVDVLTGIIKANFPTRISFQVSSKTDSRTIIDSNGAETLLGRGDMLFVPPGTARLARVHGTYLSEQELVTITDFLKAQKKPEYKFDIVTEKSDEPTVEYGEDDYDEKYQEAIEFVLSTRQASISSVQRVLRIGYNRAARIIDLMEKEGIVGPSDGSKPRQVLVNRMDY